MSDRCPVSQLRETKWTHKVWQEVAKTFLQKYSSRLWCYVLLKMIAEDPELPWVCAYPRVMRIYMACSKVHWVGEALTFLPWTKPCCRRTWNESHGQRGWRDGDCQEKPQTEIAASVQRWPWAHCHVQQVQSDGFPSVWCFYWPLEHVSQKDM